VGLLELLANRHHGPSSPPTVAATALSDRRRQRFLFQPPNPEHMKNLIKPLKWFFNSSILMHETQLNDFGCYYFIREYDGDFSATLAEKNGHPICEIGEYSTLKEAKSGCEAHCVLTIFSFLSDETRTILEQHLNFQNPTT